MSVLIQSEGNVNLMLLFFYYCSKAPDYITICLKKYI